MGAKPHEVHVWVPEMGKRVVEREGACPGTLS